MAVPQINFDLEYQFKDGQTALNAAELNPRFLSLHQRLVAVEQVSYSFDGIAVEVANLGIKRINSLVQPLVETANTELASLVEKNDQAAQLLAQLQDSGIAGTNVSIDIDGLEATDVEAALIAVMTDATHKADAAVAAANRISARTMFAGAM